MCKFFSIRSNQGECHIEWRTNATNFRRKVPKFSFDPRDRIPIFLTWFVELARYRSGNRKPTSVRARSHGFDLFHKIAERQPEFRVTE